MQQLTSMSRPEAVQGMARYGITHGNALGISIPDLRKTAEEIGKDHALAEQLWASGIHEARILACMIDDPRMVTEAQADRWAQDFDSWDVCDQCCSNLLDRTPFAHRKAVAWASAKSEFVKRAGFALMAALAVHDKKAGNSQFEMFFPSIVQEATDGRNFVKKAVNWALRQIGKRNCALNQAAIEAAKAIQKIDAPAARWIAADALRELTSEKVQARWGR